MGCWLCFGSRKTNHTNMNAQDYKLDDHLNQPRLSAEIPNPTVETSALINESNTQNEARIFTYRELATATNNFRRDSFLGQGGFGVVFKGQLENNGQAVAVKQLDKTGLQGEKEFLVEVLMLSLLCHPNLVRLIGYCAEGEQRLLVYEYMPHRSLEDHLHDLTPETDPLDWDTRMMIAAGAAKGLNYLHVQADPPVIYRDLKTSNILLGEDYHPKLSDFGLAKFGPSGDKSHVSTRVMGTHGYCAPEYAESGKLTMKSDIYSFGIVLLEIITGRRPIDHLSTGPTRFLLNWARPLYKDKRNLSLLADPALRGKYSESMLKKALEVAFQCLRDEASTRPSIGEVLVALDYITSRKYNKKEEVNRAAAKEPESDISPKRVTKILNADIDRDRAVAEAKMWGETWRERRRQNEQTDTNSWVGRLQGEQ